MSECCSRFREHAALHGCTCVDFGNDGVLVESVVSEVEIGVDGEAPVAVGTDLTISLRFRDWARYKLFSTELTALIDEMRVMASPHAERLERLTGRFFDYDESDDEAEGAA